MNKKIVEKLYKEYQTPAHVIDHCKKVEFVAKEIAEQYLKKGVNLDYESLYYACLLHDVLRIIDFNPGNGYLKMQKKLKAKYPNMNHSQAAYQLLSEMGEYKIANIIKKHAFDGIIMDENQPFILEEKIMTYADKRVLHDDIVSLQERFEDGKKRYNPENKNPKRQNKIYKMYFHLEKELFDDIAINPEDIK